MSKDTTSTVVSRGQCHSCKSSDGCVLYDDGHTFCFVCNNFTKGKDTEMSQAAMIEPDTTTTPLTNLVGKNSAIPERNLELATTKKYGVRVVQDSSGTATHHMYPYYDKDNNHIGDKVREIKGKRFHSKGNIKSAGLFGQNLFAPRGKYVTIVEGELDALAAYQMLGSKWPVLSLKNGAGAAVKDISDNLSYLQGFDTVILCFDNDEPGKKAASDAVKLFEPNKVKVVNLLEGKDACHFLKSNKRKEFMDCWWDARTYTPAGVINLGDFGDELFEEEDCKSVLYPWAGLNEKTFGIRTGELVTVTAGTGTGKSSVMRELQHHILKNTDENIGVIALEENVKRTVFHLMSVEANDRLYIKEIRDNYSREELNKFKDDTVGTRRFYAFDHFGSMDNDEILGTVRYLIKSLGCSWIFLDHLSILVSGQEDNGDERKSIDVLMTKLRSIVEETNCALILVSHLKRVGNGKGHEDGVEVSLSHLRGSQSIAQLSDIVIAMERDQQSDDPQIANTTVIRVLKNRYSGDTGPATHLLFNPDTGRLTETVAPDEEEEEDEAAF